MTSLIEFAYLFAAICFIFGIKRLSSPKTARFGNALGAVGMGVAIAATLIDRGIVEYWQIGSGLAVGSVVGLTIAKTVKMTSMPQMVAVLNGFGGGASQLVAIAELLQAVRHGESLTTSHNVSIQLTALVGAVTLSGSLIAYAKLQELISGKPITYPGRHVLNALLFVALLVLAGAMVMNPDNFLLFTLLNVGALLLGVLLVIAIGGADMPVVVSLLNSYSGVAGALAGFVIDNHALVITGALVGASGLILTQIMCKAMNRSLANVLFGGFGSAPAAGGDAKQVAGSIRQTSPEDAAMLMAYSQQVVVVPGYGLAVAQAQHQVRELADLLEKRGVVVKYAIHPVAGRMPGHMNVLLAEANIAYEKLIEMDAINPEFERTDVALVIGANDVVNPAARNTPSSPIYGMPILDVDKAKNIIVMKRGMNPGFAGIENELFYDPKTMMLFGDAKASLTKLVEETKRVE